MGSMSPALHVVTVAAGGSIDELWYLMEELAVRSGVGTGVTVHGLWEDDAFRYCVHPDSRQHIEFRGADLHGTLVTAAMWKAQSMDTEPFRRDG